MTPEDGDLAVFAAQLAHDLRNPLTSVSMSLQMLAEQPSVIEDDDALWMVDRALSGASRMDTLLEDLGRFATAGASLRRGTVDLALAMDEVRAALGARLDDVLLVTGALPVVEADPAALRTVLVELVGNAAKFSAGRPARQVLVTAVDEGSELVLEVSDNGPGIPEPDRERVLRPLTRLDRAVQGTGLGLATCRRIAEAHGGSLAVSASPEGGTLVRLRLPQPPRQ